MRIDTSAHGLTSAQRAPASARSTAAASGATPASPASATADATRADFTCMTRQELFDWMNTRIKGGEMSLDDSTGLRHLTMKLSVDGTSSALDDQERIDFMQLARDGILWGRQHHEQDQVRALQAALAILQQHQGEPLRVNLTA